MGEFNIYVYLTPLALGFIALEMFFSWYYRRGYISFQEAVANFGTALGNQTMNVLVAAGVYVVYGYLWENFRLMTIELNVFTFILLLVGVDFIFYWVHRWGHEINIMWAAHSPHHSAEEMNFFVALRASVTQRLASFLFFWPLTLIGFHPAQIYAMAGIHLFIAFLHHTEFVPKLWKPVEFIFTTPSHHRVHHGVNFRYLDKNFGEFLIIWDRVFGSFEEEKEKVVYGIYDHPRSWNPISINFHYYLVLLKLAIAAPNWWDKIRIWFMPTGWRPRGLETPPKTEITIQNQTRFRPVMFAMSKPYLAMQVIAGIVLMIGIISNVFAWSIGVKWVAAFLLWWQIVNWAGIMESKGWLWISETLRLSSLFALVLAFAGTLFTPEATAVVLAFIVASAIWTLTFFRPRSSRLSFASFD